MARCVVRTRRAAPVTSDDSEGPGRGRHEIRSGHARIRHLTGPVVPGHRVDIDVRTIAAVVRSCPLVDGLHSGLHGRIAAPAGERRQSGVLLAGSSLVVGVIGRPGASTGDIAAQVRSALAAHAPGCQVTVSVQGA